MNYIDCIPVLSDDVSDITNFKKEFDDYSPINEEFMAYSKYINGKINEAHDDDMKLFNLMQYGQFDLERVGKFSLVVEKLFTYNRLKGASKSRLTKEALVFITMMPAHLGF